MIRPEEVLKNVRVASPCPASWDSMDGDDRARYCGLCRLSVYNLSAMSVEEAARLVSERSGRLCVRFYQRRDGTVLTRDCPVGLRAIRRRIARSLVCSLVLFAAGVGYISRLGRAGSPGCSLEDAATRIRQVEPFRTALDWIDPPPPRASMGAPMPPSTTGKMVMLGAMAPPPPTP